MPSFIQSRINKYNYTNTKKSNSSKRISGSQIAPYSLNYKYNYNIPSNILNKSNLNYYDNNKRDSKRKESKNGDLNFKYIFLIMNKFFIYLNNFFYI